MSFVLAKFCKTLMKVIAKVHLGKLLKLSSKLKLN